MPSNRRCRAAHGAAASALAPVFVHARRASSASRGSNHDGWQLRLPSSTRALCCSPSQACDGNKTPPAVGSLRPGKASGGTCTPDPAYTGKPPGVGSLRLARLAVALARIAWPKLTSHRLLLHRSVSGEACPRPPKVPSLLGQRHSLDPR
eukprot:247397-Chlamydomonas_euryale.AAC.1